ncbi:MAG: hypothetical protein M9894_00730 [Planctomycetes bacterium]|nr:hypothetical protein [Planctomycetota bacterium]MCW8137426.1 hypothetical protein [Planctomycetota bacterium]
MTDESTPKKPGRRGAAQRKRSLAGTHLFLKDGVYVWRRVDPITGRRVPRTTGTSNLEIALRKAAEFEAEHERRKAGLPSLDGWKRDLGALAAEWIQQQDREGQITAGVLKARAFRIRRALDALSLRTPADLADVARLHDRVMKLEGTKVGRVVATKRHLREAWQEPLKMLSAWLAENGRVLDRDPLAAWRAIPKQGAPGRSRTRRSLLPDEFARALVASDWLDAIRGRKRPSRVVWTVALISAAREGALASRDVAHFDREHARIDFGDDVGNKRRGAGCLDPKTTSELDAYLDGRREGPLLLSPDGARVRKKGLLDGWREAVGLGIVWELWPPTHPWNVDTAYLVSQALLTGRPPVNKGGNPRLVKEATRLARAAREREVLALAATLREAWEARMVGVDMHALRKTHRTWALAAGVQEVLIDKQLGHAPQATRESMDLLRVVAGSRTGRAHYLDMRSALLDASRSAEAVRALLDEAMQRVVVTGAVAAGGGSSGGPETCAEPVAPKMAPAPADTVGA